MVDPSQLNLSFTCGVLRGYTEATRGARGVPGGLAAHAAAAAGRTKHAAAAGKAVGAAVASSHRPVDASSALRKQSAVNPKP